MLPNMASPASMQSPLPIPQIFIDNNSFTTKKQRDERCQSSTPTKKKIPPRPPSKSITQASRLRYSLNNSSLSQKAQIISFRKDTPPRLSECYNETLSDSYFKQCFKIEEKIGSGSFGDVYRVKSRDDSKYYAVKVSREKFKGKLDRDEKLNEVFKHEQLPPHDHLVKLYRAWEEKQRLYIQTELCATSLSQLADQDHCMPEETIWSYFIDLLKAVNHLHECNLLHLDIKPENIFITQNGLCKLGDFGLVYDMTNRCFNDVNEGDPKYLAFELMQGIITKAADIFSLGMTILELASDLDLPSRGNAWQMLRNGDIPNDIFSVSDDLRDIIKLMLHPDHERRPTVSELLGMPIVVHYERKRKQQLLVKRYLSYFEHLYDFVFNSLKKCLFLLPLYSLSTHFFSKQNQAQDNEVDEDSSPILPNRSYASNYYDHYSDDEESQVRQHSNTSIDLSFEQEDDFDNHILHSSMICSTVNHPNQHMALKIPMISPVVGGEAGDQFDPLKSVSQRLVFDDFSDEEMMSEEEEEESDNSVDLFRVDPSSLSIRSDLTSPSDASTRLRNNVTRKNLLRTFEETESNL